VNNGLEDSGHAGTGGLERVFVAAEFAAVGARASRLEIEAKDNLLARLALGSRNDWISIYHPASSA